MKITSIIVILISISIAGCKVKKENAASQITDTLNFADRWEYVGIAVEEPGYTIWGTSPIMDSIGNTHLFVARWPCELKVDPGWRTHSEIAHYISDNPKGPFKFNQVIGKGKENGKWNSKGFHNPSVKKIDDKYVIVYIANNGAQKHGPNQRIGMLLSDNINGPWKELPNEEEPLLSPPDEKNIWCFKSGCGVNNPTLIKRSDGKYLLYFKAMSGPRPEGKISMGLAIADNLEGPYIIQKKRVTSNDMAIEDGYVFKFKNKICLLTTDNHGMIEEGGGILWFSDDGINFNNYEKGFHRLSDYTNVDFTKAALHYGPGNKVYAKIERPQLLLIDGKPRFLYGPGGTNIYGGDCTISYVFEFFD